VFDDLLVFSIGLIGAKWFCNLSLTIDILGFVVLVDLKFIWLSIWKMMWDIILIFC